VALDVCGLLVRRSFGAENFEVAPKFVGKFEETGESHYQTHILLLIIYAYKNNSPPPKNRGVWNFIFDDMSKTCLQNSSFITIQQQ
jgi:hypothetical protein